jgi:deoxycytidylate deaminase
MLAAFHAENDAIIGFLRDKLRAEGSVQYITTLPS